MSATETNPLNRVECDFHEYGIDGEYTFGSSDPGEDGFSLYHGWGFDVGNPFEQIGEQYATDETVAKLIELVEAYEGAEIADLSHLDPRNAAYYCEVFQVEFVAVYRPGESDHEAQMRLVDGDAQRFHTEAMVLYNFRDRFCEAIGFDTSSLYPRD